ncbi:MAG: helix-turn-helix transcriptional regulator [Acidimicrobiia bacterium]
MDLVRRIRRSAGLTQVELARAAGTSQPAIAAYESAAKVPSLRTLRRLAAAVGMDLHVTLVPALTREERRSLALHQRIAERLVAQPEPTLAKARSNLDRMRRLHPHATGVLQRWEHTLNGPLEDVAEALTDPRTEYREMRHVTPFAGVLDTSERAAVYRRFRLTEARS